MKTVSWFSAGVSSAVATKMAILHGILKEAESGFFFASTES